MTNRKKNRSPAEIAADLRAQLAKVESRAALESAQESPELAPLVDVLNVLKEQKTVLARKNSGPQSFENRLMKKQLWLNQIYAEQDLNNAKLADLSDRIETLSGVISNYSQQLAEGEKIPAEDIQAVRDRAHTSADLWDQEYNVEAATTARKNFGKKEESEDDGEEMTAEA